MSAGEEEKVNIIIGDALLSLFEEEADISAETLSARLKLMLETETDKARRRDISNAIRETGGFFHSAGYADDCTTDESRHRANDRN